MTDRVIRRLFGAAGVVNATGLLAETSPGQMTALAEWIISEAKEQGGRLWQGGFGLYEFMTSDEVSERNAYFDTIVGSSNIVTTMAQSICDDLLANNLEPPKIGDYTSDLYFEYFLLARGRLSSLADLSMVEYDTALSPQILKRRSYDNPFEDEYTYPLPPEKIELPEDLAPEEEMAFRMKHSLSLDPIMKEMDNEFGRQANPFNAAIDKAVGGLITWAGGPLCGGYYAGDDPDGYPLFVTAHHCADSRTFSVIMANGQEVACEVVQVEGDTLIARGAEKLSGVRPLLLGQEIGPWGLAVSPSHMEAELLHNTPSWPGSNEFWEETFPGGMYSYVNREGGGWSGSPMLNSRGEVTGIVSGSEKREGTRYAKCSAYSPLDTLIALYEKAGVGYLLGGY